MIVTGVSSGIGASTARLQRDQIRAISLATQAGNSGSLAAAPTAASDPSPWEWRRDGTYERVFRGSSEMCAETSA